MDKQPTYYAILTADVRYNNNLSSSVKLFYAEITALTNKSGKCWASNSYFAELYGVSNSTITSWINALKDEGLIDVEYQREDNQVKKRIITIRGSQNSEQGYSENPRGGSQKIEGGYSENLKENNTSNNNTSNNTTRESFTERLDSAETKQELLDLWIEYRKSKNKHAGLQEQDIILNRDWKGKGVDEIRESIAYTVKNGWLTLQWEEKEEQKPQMSYHQEI